MFSRSLIRSSRVLRPTIVATGRPFHTSAVVCTSFKDVIKEAAKDFGDTSPQHAEEISNSRNEALTGGMLGTATGRIADEQSGSTPGYTPNVPNPLNPNPKTWKDYPSAGKFGKEKTKPAPSEGRTTSSSGSSNASSYNPTPGTTSGTGTVPGEPGATRPIPSAPGSPAGASASRTATSATSSTGNNPTPGIPTRKYSTFRQQDKDSSSSTNHESTSSSTIDTTGTFADINAKIGGILGLYGAPTFTKGENVIDVIKSDHRKVESLYADFQRSSDKQRKQELAQDIIKNLVQHSEVEQMLVYPLLKMRSTPNGQSLHDRSLAEHQEVRELLYKLDQTSFDDPSYETQLKAVMDATLKHVEEEESEVLPALAEKFVPEELQFVGGAFETHKYTAPTRPHPSAPMQGPLAAAAGMAAKPLDLARDALRKATGK